MYRITFEIQNPIADQAERLSLQFDPSVLDRAQWADIFPLIEEKIDAVATRSESSEPQRWADAVVAATAKPISP